MLFRREEIGEGEATTQVACHLRPPAPWPKAASPSRARRHVRHFSPRPFQQIPRWWASCAYLEGKAFLHGNHGNLTSYHSSFLQFVSDRASFDSQLESYVQTTYVQDKLVQLQALVPVPLTC